MEEKKVSRMPHGNTSFLRKLSDASASYVVFYGPQS